MINSNFLVTFVSQSGLANAGYDVNSWPLYVSNIYNKPGKFKCNHCGNLTCKSAIDCFVNSKFIFIEFSPEIINDISIEEEIQLQNTSYSLKGLVWCYQKHFTCAVHIEGKWVYFDDLCNFVKHFSSLKLLQQQYPFGWFFIILQVNNDTNHVSHSDYHDFICNNHLPLKHTKANHSEYVNEEISSSKRKKTENKNQIPLTQLPSEQDTVKHDKTSEMSSEQTNVFDQ